MKFRHLAIVLTAAMMLQSTVTSAELIGTEEVLVDEIQDEVQDEVQDEIVTPEEEETGITEELIDEPEEDDGSLIIDDDSEVIEPVLDETEAQPETEPETVTEKEPETEPLQPQSLIVEKKATDVYKQGSLGAKVTYVWTKDGT